MPPALIHYHIPKTAGTSLKRALESWYGALIRESQSNLDELDLSNSCVTGHFGALLTGHPSSLLDTFSGAVSNPNFRVITILRNPLDHLLSAYYHHQEKVPAKNIRSLREFLIRHNRFMYRHSLQFRPDVKADQVLKSFLFVGDAADMQGTLGYLSELLGKIHLPAVRQNVGDRDIQYTQVTKADRQKIEKLLSPEFELYERAREMIARKDFTGAPDARLEQFSYVNPCSEDPFPGDGFLDESVVSLGPEDQGSTPEIAFEIIDKKNQRIQEQSDIIASLNSQLEQFTAQANHLREENSKLKDVVESFRTAALKKAELVSALRKDAATLISRLTTCELALEKAKQAAILEKGTISSLMFKVEDASSRLAQSDEALHAFRTLSENQASKIAALRERIERLNVILPEGK